MPPCLRSKNPKDEEVEGGSRLLASHKAKLSFSLASSQPMSDYTFISTVIRIYFAVAFVSETHAGLC